MPGTEEPDDTTDTWVALLHTPGPNAPQDGSLFRSRGFANHVAFLERMHEAGFLVAAGPLEDEDGAGLTVLRLPGPGRMDDARRLATQDDASVANGFFSCQVRPWRVLLTS